MTFGGILDAILISPLKLVFEIIFQTAYELIQDPGISIIFLSLAINLLVLPLYKRADHMQELARDTEAALAPGIKHIKKTFSGNERFMMLQTYYRQNDYSPLNALKGSTSLLLEIPFFMAAYQFLSRLDILQGASLGPIKDLGAPDGMLVIGGLAINLLPVLMTLINFVSSAIYLKGFPLKTKVQLYALAIFFLVFLYDSPSGLVFYWTLNNVFSLGKNIVYKIVRAVRARNTAGAKAEQIQAKTGKKRRAAAVAEPDRRIFIAAAVFLTVFTGLLIPSTYIASSPQEFIPAGTDFSPIWYIVRTFCLAAGLFLLWFSVFYWLASPRGKRIFERIMWVLSGIAVADYMFFGTKLGILSSALKYEGGMVFSRYDRILNPIVLIVLGVVMVLAAIKLPKLPRPVLTVAAAAMVVMSGINIVNIGRSVSGAVPAGNVKGPHFELSKEGRNVVVLFLDRAMGEYMPYLLAERPDLARTYDGFTFYRNTISFGGHTNMGAPALMGGYEYTPVELNKRDTELLRDKHNEALKVMPVMFLKNGFNVTVCDAPYANYEWIPDMSIYDEWPEINTYITKGYFGDVSSKEQVIERNFRNFFCFSVMKILPLELQPLLYDGGHYMAAGSAGYGVFQMTFGKSNARGMSEAFMGSYAVLDNLDTMSSVKSGKENNFVFLYNDTPHEPMLLQEPEYKPALSVDNEEFDRKHAERFTVDGSTIRVNSAEQMMHYQTNMSVLLKIGEWLDYLRANGVYDNTRIIIVSDHGYYLHQDADLQVFRKGRTIDISNYYPLFMVKDFGSTGFKVSDEFMTNADTPVLAADGLIKAPVNPFTGKPLDSSEKTAHDQFVITSQDWGVDTNNGNCFKPSSWAVLTKDLRDMKDWEFIDDKIVLKEHKMP